MKQLLIYDQPVALNRTQHRHVRIKPSLTDFHFADKLNSVPLTVAEFADAARHYPIVFAGEPGSVTMPVALLGLTQAENLFVQADGRWETDAYIPAFLRRYPFVVANQEQVDSFTVCVDKSFISDGDDAVALFDEGGADAPALAQAVKFLGDYQQAVERTRKFMQQLCESKLLIDKTIRVERQGQDTQSLKGFCVVDEERLQKLSGRAVDKLFRTGALGLVYVHLASLSSVSRLAWRMDARRRLHCTEH
jgi:hypothetical protein